MHFVEFNKLLSLLRPQTPRMTVAAIFMSISAAATAGVAYLAGPVLKSLFWAGPSAPSMSLTDESLPLVSHLANYLSGASPLMIGGLLVAVSVVKGGAFYLQRMLVIQAGQRVLFALRQSLYEGVLQMNPLQRDKEASGNLISRFTVDSHVVEQAVTGGMMALIGNLLQVVALTALALSLSLEMGLLGIAALPLVAVVVSRLGKILRVRQGRFYDAYHDVSQIVDESLQGLGVLQSFGATQFAAQRFAAASSNLMKRAAEAFEVSAMSTPLNEILGAMALGGTIWFAHGKIESGALSSEAFISFFTSLFLLYQPVKGVGNAIHALQAGYASLDKLAPMLHPTKRFTPRQALGSEVWLDGIVAGYDDGDEVLKNLSLRVAAGEKVAIVGESGAGKTTLLHVLCGYLVPQQGTIESSWPVGVVSQVPFLFDDSIYVNVTLGNPNIPDDVAQRACQQAGVWDFAVQYAEGLAYRVGPGGSNLSAGERQRVSLARALAHGEKLLLLDEVTASLDGKNEMNITDALTELTDTTVIAVTHRARTAQWAQRTLVLADGHIVDEGPFDELLKRSPVVSRLFAATETKDTNAC